MAPRINEYRDIASMQLRQRRLSAHIYETIDRRAPAPAKATCETKCSCCCCLNSSQLKRVYTLLALYGILYYLIIGLKIYFHNNGIYSSGVRLLNMAFSFVFFTGYCLYKYNCKLRE